jgi:flagellar assembly factor FliW
MRCDSTIDTEAPQAATGCNIRVPMGLLGFEQIKDYLLVISPAEAPFRWLQVRDNPALAFVVIEPFIVLPDYHPDIPQQDVEFLGLKSPEDALLLNIVTVQSATRATVNLKGPVVVNRTTGVGKQVVIANATDYSVKHPLPLAEATA